MEYLIERLDRDGWTIVGSDPVSGWAQHYMRAKRRMFPKRAFRVVEHPSRLVVCEGGETQPIVERVEATMIHLIIKGTVGEAIASGREHGIELCGISKSRHQDETRAYTTGALSDVQAWFAEGSEQAPFPSGTLLYFSNTD